jgi:ATP-dependent Clp protease ATP-binding subunit ClpA
VEAVAESLVGDARAVVKVDCAEFQHSHEISKLIGSPPGYLGHRETHAALSQDALNAHHTDTVKLSFVLFDEIEKASDALWNLLLGILDKATLTLGDNRKVDFSRAMIFMTSNLGAAEMDSLVRPRLGFASGESVRGCDAGLVGTRFTERINRIGLEAARRKFTPEFMNRIDRTVVFRSLGTEELRGILSIELKAVQDRILSTASSAAFVLTVTESARDFLLREGTDLKYGARHLKRAIERYLVHPLSNLIATEQVSSGDLLRIDFDDAQAQLTFLKDVSWRPASVIARLANSSGNSSAGPARSGAATEPMRWLRARNKP